MIIRVQSSCAESLNYGLCEHARMRIDTGNGDHIRAVVVRLVIHFWLTHTHTLDEMAHASTRMKGNIPKIHFYLYSCCALAHCFWLVHTHKYSKKIQEMELIPVQD